MTALVRRWRDEVMSLPDNKGRLAVNCAGNRATYYREGLKRRTVYFCRQANANFHFEYSQKHSNAKIMLWNWMFVTNLVDLKQARTTEKWSACRLLLGYNLRLTERGIVHTICQFFFCKACASGKCEEKCAFDMWNLVLCFLSSIFLR